MLSLNKLTKSAVYVDKKGTNYCIIYKSGLLS